MIVVIKIENSDFKKKLNTSKKTYVANDDEVTELIRKCKKLVQLRKKLINEE